MKIISVKGLLGAQPRRRQYHRRPGHPPSPAVSWAWLLGSSPVGTYQELVRRCQAGELDFSQVRTVNLDEYVGLNRDHDQSYAYFMRDNLFDHVNLDPASTNVPDGMDPDGAAACARYDQIIRDLGGIDLQLLGLGVNGHIGFNEPAESFSLGTHQVELTDSTRQANRRFFSSLEEVPTHARTMGVRDIMQARKVLMVANRGGQGPGHPGRLLRPGDPTRSRLHPPAPRGLYPGGRRGRPLSLI